MLFPVPLVTVLFPVPVFTMLFPVSFPVVFSELYTLPAVLSDLDGQVYYPYILGTLNLFQWIVFLVIPIIQVSGLPALRLVYLHTQNCCSSTVVVY